MGRKGGLIDAVFLRQMALGGLVALTAAKVHALIKYIPTVYTLVLFAGMDTLFLSIVHHLQIPKLKTTKLTSLLLLFLFVSLDTASVYLLNRHYAPEPPARQKLSIPPKQDSSNIAGSHIVRVVPPTLIKLNPNSTQYCLLSGQKDLSIPLLIKGTPPWTIDYTHFPHTGAPVQFTDHSITSPSTTRRVSLHTLHVTAPGLYRIDRIREKSGVEGRVIPNWTRVNNCPEAHWGSEKKLMDKCVGDEIEFQMVVYGVPPLRVSYVEKISGVERVVGVDVLGDESVFDESKPTPPQTISTPIKITLSSATLHTFQILSVIDAQSNLLTYPSQPSKSPSLDFPAGKSALITHSKKGDHFLIDTHTYPSARFIGCEDLRIKDGEEKDIMVRFEGESPWKLQWDDGNGVVEVSDIQDQTYPLKIHQPGTYTLQSITDAYCHTRFPTPPTCTVARTIPPSAHVSAESIEQACVGAIGTLVHVELIGSPPFWIEYQQSVKETGMKRTERVDVGWKFKYTLDLKPKDPGTYVYRFLNVGDKNFPKGNPIQTPPITQIIHPQSTASFSQPSKEITNCVDDLVRLPVRITGSGPWRLRYDVVIGDEKDEKIIDTSDGGVVIEVKSRKGGEGVVSLIEITDGNSCSWPLNVPEVVIHTLPKRPSVSFDCQGELSVLEGEKVGVPVVLDGKPPFSLDLRGADGKILTVTSGKSGRSNVDVMGTGMFELVGVSDKYCVGEVVGVKSCAVKTTPKPTVQLLEKDYITKKAHTYIKKPICQGTPSFLEFQCTGQAPYKVHYVNEIRQMYDDRWSSKQIAGDESIGTRVGKIHFSTDVVGVQRITLDKVSDDRYRKYVGLVDKIVVEQEILQNPDVRILDGPDIDFRCVGEQPMTTPTNAQNLENTVKFEFKGTPPFSLTLEIIHESQTRRLIPLSEIMTKKFDYKPTITETGKHTLRIIHVADKSGCERSFESDGGTFSQKETYGSTTVNIHVSDVPKIIAIKAPESVCVGDVLLYSLQGSPPFTIFFLFDGKLQQGLSLEDSVLSLYAGSPGTMRIAQVCNSMNCCTKPEGLETVIRDLPKAFMDGGTHIEEDIREGDETEFFVEFQGIPPFSFTYTRDSAIDESSLHEETFTVKDIQQSKYYIRTSQSGTFQVTAVYDKYCGFPRIGQGNVDADFVVGEVVEK